MGSPTTRMIVARSSADVGGWWIFSMSTVIAMALWYNFQRFHDLGNVKGAGPGETRYVSWSLSGFGGDGDLRARALSRALGGAAAPNADHRPAAAHEHADDELG